jgi:hypothetical protein
MGIRPTFQTVACHRNRPIKLRKAFAMNRILWMLCVAATIGACCKFSTVAQAAQSNLFQWATRPQLTTEQQKMLQLQKGLEITREDSPLHAENQDNLAALRQKLGPLAVRMAKANELIMSRISTNACTIHNPTAEGLVLTVSIVGDVEQLGNRMASMGREAYFPPGSTIIVTNLYWTTPSTAKRETP